jgi:hypothetical protein
MNFDNMQAFDGQPRHIRQSHANLFKCMRGIARNLTTWVFLPYKQTPRVEAAINDYFMVLWREFEGPNESDRQFRARAFWEAMGLDVHTAWNDAYYSALWSIDAKDRAWLPARLDTAVPWNFVSFLDRRHRINEIINQFRINISESEWKARNAHTERSVL